MELQTQWKLFSGLKELNLETNHQMISEVFSIMNSIKIERHFSQTPQKLWQAWTDHGITPVNRPGWRVDV
jgi:hypothetical protein